MIKNALYKLMVPSWRSTLTDAKYEHPFKKAFAALDSNGAALPAKISPEQYCQHILQNNITSDSQKRLVQQYSKMAKLDGVIIVAFLLSMLVICFNMVFNADFTIFGIKPPYALLILLTCIVQTLRLLVDHLHKAKQIVAGCAFPNYLMITSPKNLSNWYEGVYYRNTLVYRSMPLIDETLDKLRELEGLERL